MSMDRFDGVSNTTGLYRVRYQDQYFYFLTCKTNTKVQYPPLTEEIGWAEKIRVEREAIFRTTRNRGIPLSPPSAEVATPTATTTSAQAVTDRNERLRERDQTATESPTPKRIRLTTPDAKTIAQQCFLESPEGLKLFGLHHEEKTPKEVLEGGIRKLAAVNGSSEGWRNVVDGRDADNCCSPSEIHAVQQRCLSLCQAYILALKKMGRGAGKWTWKHCCETACEVLNPLGVEQATNAESIQRYNLIFRSDGSFPNPNQHALLGKKPEPHLFQVYPELKQKLNQFYTNKVATLTIESAYSHVHETLIPDLHKLFVADLPENAPVHCQSIEHFYHCFGLKNLSLTTVWRWMKYLGFTYSYKKKCFYVDGHEWEDVVADRQEFCQQYLTEIEPRCKRWIQITKALSDALQEKLKDRPCFQFANDEGVDMVEYHVDDIEDVQELSLNFQVNISYRAPPNAKPLMLIGQDECIFAQYLFGQKHWVTPAGQRPLMPKLEGDIYMVSAFQSRDIGFGRSMTIAELQQVNEKRSTEHYVDTEAAMGINKTTKKPALKQSPFLRYIHVGVNNDGHWNSWHMSIQLEDIADCLLVLHSDFDVLVLFDHSAGHDRKREGALSALSASKGFGGAQPKMRNCKIKQFAGYLGVFNPKLSVGDVQRFQFQVDDAGPFYLSAQQKLDRKHDKPTGVFKQERKKKQQLIKELKGKGVPLARGMAHTYDELKGYATSNGVSLNRNVEKIQEGWLNKLKGILQILWERGLIDETKLNSYTLDGRTNPQGKTIPNTSLRQMLANCHDFANEESALQFLGRKLGISIKHSPKFHAEIAGEGIEYSWACSKGEYRLRPLSAKRGLQNFKATVRSCVSPAVLSKARVCKFSRRARAYICTYYVLHQRQQEAANQQQADAADGREINPQQALFQEIERLQKQFKTHRCTLDFDAGFVNAVVKESGS